MERDFCINNFTCNFTNVRAWSFSLFLFPLFLSILFLSFLLFSFLFSLPLSPQEPKIAEVQKFADQLVQSRHYAAVEIAERRASVLSAWAKLKQSLVDWRSRLGQSQSLQQFNREVDEVDAWLSDRLQTAGDESYRDPTNLENKLQKHETFEGEVEANKERVFLLVQSGKGKDSKCLTACIHLHVIVIIAEYKCYCVYMYILSLSLLFSLPFLFLFLSF